MATKKKADAPAPPKKKTKKQDPPVTGSVKHTSNAQAWENGKSVACAKDESK